MSLVWEFSNTLRVNVLKRLNTNLFNFKGKQELKNGFIKLLDDKSINYEEVVGRLERAYLETKITNNTEYEIIIQLIECIQLLLLEEQKLATPYMKAKFPDYVGLKGLVKNEGIIDIYSLNHDLILEELCEYHNIPYKDGFYENRNTGYSNIANFKSITSDELNAGQLNFYEKSDESGINLFKLHGSLDLFAANDKNIYLKCVGNGKYIGSYSSEAERIEKHSLELCRSINTRGVNELFVKDENDKLQFLRRSLLSGSHKFTDKFEQVAPRSLFDAFRNRITDRQIGYTIGYSFGDAHVNKVFLQWLKNTNSKLFIYDPYRKSLPDNFNMFSKQIKIVNGGFTEFLEIFESVDVSIFASAKRAYFKLCREKLKEARLGKI